MDLNRFDRGVVRPDPLPDLNQRLRRDPRLVKASIRACEFEVPGALLDDLAAEIELLRAALASHVLPDLLAPHVVWHPDRRVIHAHDKIDGRSIVLFKVPAEEAL